MSELALEMRNHIKELEQPVGCNPTRPSLGARRPSQRRRGRASLHQKMMGPGR
jgi:hypothetical protein